MTSALPVRVTAAGSWYLPADGGVGSKLRLVEGIPAEAVRRVRDLGLLGLLPIGNVVDHGGWVCLRTPQPPGPALTDLLEPGAALGTDDALAVIGGIGRTLRALHGRGWCHGGVDGNSVLLDPEGQPLLVMVQPGSTGPHRDADGLAGLASALADAWCDPAGATLLRRCASLAECAGLDVALGALPRLTPAPAPARRAAARAWTSCLRTTPTTAHP